MPTRNMILHVGTHKTGTSSLQTMLARNAEHFLSEGLYYPATGRIGYGQHNLAWELSGDDRYRPVAGRLVDLAAELHGYQLPELVLVSSEDFEILYTQPRALARLRMTFEHLGYSVWVVITLRNPADYLESLYVELLKHGLEQEFDAFVSDTISNGCVSLRDWRFCLDYARLVRSFATAFDRTSLRILAYDPSDSVRPILHTCQLITGAPIEAIEGCDRFNVRPADARLRYRLDPPQRLAVGDAFGGSFSDVVTEFAPFLSMDSPRAPEIQGVASAR